MADKKKANPLVIGIIAILIVGVIVFFAFSGDSGSGQLPQTAGAQSQRISPSRTVTDADSSADSLDALTVEVGGLQETIDESSRAQKEFMEDQERIAREARKEALEANKKAVALEQELRTLKDEIRKVEPAELIKKMNELKEFSVGKNQEDRVDAASLDRSYKILTNDKGEPLVDSNGYVSILPLEDTFEFAEDSSKRRRSRGKDNNKEQEQPPIPVYTFSVGSTGIEATSMSALVGKIPKGGKVNEPFRFKIVAGSRLLTANGHDIKGLDKTIILGTAIGDASVNCIVGTITDITFVFVDGTISHTESNDTEGLGYLSDTRGLPCISGRRVNNFSSFLTGQLLADTIRFTGEAYADSAVELTRFSDNSATLSISDRSDLIAGRVTEGAGTAISNMIAQQTSSVFDIVYAPSGTKITINFEEQIEVDYNPLGRRTHYDHLAETNYNALD